VEIRQEGFAGRHGHQLVALYSDAFKDVPQEVVALAGGPWPKRGRQTALLLSAGSEEEREPSVRLLADIRTVFDVSTTERLRTTALINDIAQLNEGEFEGPLAPRELAAHLRPFDIRPKKFRFGLETAQGYERRQFEETWRRYLT